MGRTEFRTIIIGGQPHQKPWDRTCGACQSPWLVQIDSALAEGYTFRAVRALLLGRKPGPPNEEILAAHVSHLALPHRKMRDDIEASRGLAPEQSLAGVPEATRAVIRKGFELLAAGQLEISARDWLKALELQTRLDLAGQGTADTGTWQAAFMAFFEIARAVMSVPQWEAFTAAVHSSPEIQAVMAEAKPVITATEGT